MKFIHVADVHLFAQPDQGTDWAEGRSKEIEETFEKVIDACNEKDVDLLLIAGDLFDRSPSVEDLIFVDEKQKLALFSLLDVFLFALNLLLLFSLVLNC